MLPHDQVDVYPGIDSEVGDFLDYTRRTVDIDNSLVNAHFESVPSVGSFSTWTFSGCDPQDLGGDADWSLGFESLILGPHDDLGTGGFKWLYFFAS